MSGAGATQSNQKDQKTEKAAKKRDAKSQRVTKKNACSVIRRADVEQALGGEAERGMRQRIGLDAECNWTVGATDTRPAGRLRIGVHFEVPPGAYEALANNPGWEDVPGIGTADSLYQRLTGTLHVFKGNRVLRLQGIFNDTTTRPITTYDARDELVELANLADPRL